jgi:hypothetical protein
MVYQDTTDALCRDGVKMRAVLPGHALLNEAHVGLVNDLSTLEGMARTLAPQVAGRKPPQFVIHYRRQRVQCAPVSTSPSFEQAGDVGLSLFQRLAPRYAAIIPQRGADSL